MDTVGVEEAESWSYPPFEGCLVEAAQEGREAGGSSRLYGRGAADMKGALAAMICAILDVQREHGGAGDLPYSLALTATAAEETYEGYSMVQALELLRAEGYEPAAVLVGEASSLDLMRGQRGRAEIRLTSHGKSAHSAHPEAGVNSIISMSRLLDRFSDVDVPEDPELGRGISTITDIISSPYPGASVIPDHCFSTIDRRSLVGETEKEILSGYFDLISRVSETFPDLVANAELVTRPLTRRDGGVEEVRQFHPAWKLPLDHPLVMAALDALEGAGIRARLRCYDFCTNGSGSAGREGIPTIGFGPGEESLAHIRDEYVETEELYRALEGYRAIAEGLSSFILEKN